MDPIIRHQLGKIIQNNIDEIVKQLFTVHFDKNHIKTWDLNVPKDDDITRLRESFIRPLIKLLINYCNSGNETILSVYLDERLRFAPHSAPIIERRKFHQELVNKDKTVLDDFFNNIALKDAWTELHLSLIAESNMKKLNVLAVGDCLLNELRVFAPHAARAIDIELDFRCMYFSAGYTGGMDHTAVLAYIENNKIDLILFSFFTFDAMPGYSRMMQTASNLSNDDIINQCKMMTSLMDEFLDNVRSSTLIPFAIHNVSGLPLSRWRKHLPFLSPHSKKQKLALDTLNDAIMKMIRAKPNMLLIDELALVEQKGYHNSNKEVVPQKKYKGPFHSSHLGQYLTTPYNILFSAYKQLGNCKVLLVDFDNTIWKGVMADGDVEQYRQRQRLLIALKNVGIVLVAISKNNPDNIRWAEMEIKQKDFALLKISWEPKVKTILEAVAELNLGKDNFVLLDDNRHERIQVANGIPEISSLDPDDELTWKKLNMIFSFPNTMETDEAKNRTQLYQQQAQRQKTLKIDVDYASMMQKLELWHKYHQANKQELPRIHELVSRTNQFNTTTRRYSESDIQQMISSSQCQVMTAEVGDKFGSLGIVAVIIINYHKNDAFIDTFIMSCRAMGLGLENQLLYRAEQSAKTMGSNKIIGEYIPSDRNQPCENLYNSNNYRETSTGWIKDLETGEPCKKVSWFEERT